MPRGDLEHTEEILYKQSREHLSGDSFSSSSDEVSSHKTSWDHDDLDTGEYKSSSSLSFKIFIFSSFLCVFAGAFLFYTLTVRSTSIDSKKITINLEASPYVEGGQSETLSVTVSNGNAIALNEAKLTLVYDKGGTVTGEPEKITETKDMGDIVPQAVIKQEFPFTVYGEKDEKRPLAVRLDYKIKGSNAVFPKEVSTEVTLSVPPLLVALEGAESVVSGEQTEYTAVLKNETATSSQEGLLLLSAPAGFSLIKVSEQQISGAFAWTIPKLAPGEEKRVSFRAVFTGVIGEKATLKVTVGSKKEDVVSIDKLFSYDAKVITYAKPGLTGDLVLSTDRGDTSTLRKGDKVDAKILYRNDGASKISYVQYSLGLPEGIDPRQVYVSQSGYYDVGTHSIIWSSDAYDRLLTLGAGQGGELTFSFVVPDDFKDTSLPLLLSTKGVDSTLGKPTQSSKDFSFLVSGSTAFTAYTLYKDDLRPNTGPFPPKVNTETTFTGVLTVSTQADIANAKVAFTIPSLYVKYLDGVSSSSAVSYDSRSKLVSWNIGAIKKGEMQTASVKFSVKPSLTHFGTTPNISSRILLTGENSVTKEKIQQVSEAFTTAVKDVGLDDSFGNVIK
jgi:hypothetical protein